MRKFLAVLVLAGSVSVAQAQLIGITEFINDPSSLSDADGEWLELFNYGDVTVDLQNFVIRDDGSNTVTLPSISIDSGAYVVLAVNKSLMETEWFGAANPNVYDVNIASLGNTADELVLENASSAEIWRIAWASDDVTGESTFLTGNDFSINNYGSDGSPGIVRNGNDLVAGSPLGYQTQSATSDAFSFSSTGGDTGSPLAGQYTPVPEPSTLAFMGLALGSLLAVRRRRVG